MNIIGELAVQIGAIGNSKEVKAFANAVNSAGKAIDNFNKKSQESNSTQQKFNTNLLTSMAKITAIVTSVRIAYGALDRLTDSLAKQNLHWINLARQSNIAMSTFQKWGTIGKIVGVDNVEQQLQSLEQRIFRLKLTGEGASGFQMAGIMPTNSEDVLEQLRSRISGMNDTSATFLLEQMGLNPEMITLLRMGRKEWEQYLAIQEKYTLKENDRQNIEKMRREIEVSRIKIQYFKDKAILALMPLFTKFRTSLVRIGEMFLKLGDRLKKPILALLLFGHNLKGVLNFTRHLSHTFTRLIAKVIRFGGVFQTLGAIFAKALLPITALYLILDDLAVFFEGGDSLIGRVVKWGKERGGEIWEGLSQIFGGDILGGASKTIEGVLNTLNDVLNTIADLLTQLVDFLSFGLLGKPLEWFKSRQNQWIEDGLNLNSKIPGIGDFPQGAVSPVVNTMSNIRNHNQSQNNTFNMDIHTTESSKEIIKGLYYANNLITN